MRDILLWGMWRTAGETHANPYKCRMVPALGWGRKLLAWNNEPNGCRTIAETSEFTARH